MRSITPSALCAEGVLLDCRGAERVGIAFYAAFSAAFFPSLSASSIQGTATQ